MATDKPSFRILVWYSGEVLPPMIDASFADAEVLVLRNCPEPDRVARVVVGFLPDVVICGRLEFQSLGSPATPPAPRQAYGDGAGELIPIRLTRVAARPRLNLNHRDWEVLLCLYRGLTNKEIAQNFGVSTRTVKSYLSRLFAVFDVSNRTELVGSAVDLGLYKSTVHRYRLFDVDSLRNWAHAGYSRGIPNDPGRFTGNPRQVEMHNGN